ncbi:partial Histidinol-phosphate aminotransferase, partial [Methylococcales bacterium]
RIGIGFGPEALIRELYKVKLPFEPNALAQAAAIAALQDDDFIKRTQKVNRESLISMREGLTKIGIPFTNSAANFLLLLFKDEPEASRFNEECMNRGLILRHVITFGIPNGIRMNSGTPEETEFALQVIKEVWDLLHS